MDFIHTIYKMAEPAINSIIVFMILRYLLYQNIKLTKRFFIALLIAELGIIPFLYYNIEVPFESFYAMLIPAIANLFGDSQIRISNLGYGILCHLLIETMEALLLEFINTCSRTFHFSISKPATGSITLLIMFMFWIVLTYYINHKHYGSLQRRHFKFFIFITIVAFFNSGVYNIITTVVFSSNLIIPGRKWVVEWSLLLFGVALMAEITFIILLYYEKTHYSIINDFTQEYLEIEKEHFKKLQQQEQDTRKFRHDIHNHLMVINRFAEEEKTEKLKEYLHSVNESFATIQSIYHTGHEIIDSILDKKSNELKQNYIKLEMDGNLSNFASMDDFDLCTIFSNALQNAIEACIQLPETSDRCIKIRFRSKASWNILEFTNPVKEDLKIKNNRLVTSKSDKKNHGFGLVQIEQIVQNYNGNLYLTYDNHIFKLIVQLEQEKK